MLRRVHGGTTPDAAEGGARSGVTAWAGRRGRASPCSDGTGCLSLPLRRAARRGGTPSLAGQAESEPVKLAALGDPRAEPRTADAGSPTVVLPKRHRARKARGRHAPLSNSISTGECVALSFASRSASYLRRRQTRSRANQRRRHNTDGKQPSTTASTHDPLPPPIDPYRQ
jgi:hypothetical protein